MTENTIEELNKVDLTSLTPEQLMAHANKVRLAATAHERVTVARDFGRVEVPLPHAIQELVFNAEREETCAASFNMRTEYEWLPDEDRVVEMRVVVEMVEGKLIFNKGDLPDPHPEMHLGSGGVPNLVHRSKFRFS